jgi:hypothetical protein
MQFIERSKPEVDKVAGKKAWTQFMAEADPAHILKQVEFERLSRLPMNSRQIRIAVESPGFRSEEEGKPQH